MHAEYTARVGAHEALLLSVVSLLAGAINGIAGGGSFLTFPTLAFSGVTALAANATSTVALWPASIASAFAYRRELQGLRTWLAPLGAVSALGGLLGARLALASGDRVFTSVVPFLMLLAVLTFTFQPRLTPRPPEGTSAPRRVPFALLAAQFGISLYGGYFGGGMGLMMLATYGVFSLGPLHQMNALKTVLGVAINLAALIIFSLSGQVDWVRAVVMAVSSSVGGFASVVIARRVPVPWVRVVVIAIGWAMTLVFFWRTFA